MKRYLILGWVLWVAMAANVSAESANPVYVALGDSITAGYHRDAETQKMYDFPFSFSGRIEQAKDWNVANLGITNLTSGEFLAELKQNEDWKKAIQNAKWITLEIGANDLIRNPTFFPYIFQGKTVNQQDIDLLTAEKMRVLNQYESNLREAVGIIQQESTAKLIVLNHYYLPFPGMAGELINSAIIDTNKKLADLSREKGFYVADLATAFSAAMTLSFFTQDLSVFPIDAKNFDPHPSEYGQKLISMVLLDMMEEKQKNELIPTTLASVFWVYLLSLFHS